MEVIVCDNDDDHILRIFFDHIDIGCILFFRDEKMRHMDRAMEEF